MGYDYGHMGGWGWAGMSIGFVLFFGLVAAAVIYAVRSSNPQVAPAVAERTPRQVLDDRLARGEISSTDYQNLMAALSGSRSPR